ncbi:hypothetical protein [Aquibium oceanicum]|uniref:Uncharacterized protein n=1 Tax=Aquibium oceanicum TaxID=1670800 RepID=A0A1L3SXU7_9HYPH|nr:hypothetical protein [Aquibium oceanicum]APH74142.1 hypothetical protein BSQ44_24295 [Aquibium oceanicum]
MAKVLTVDEMIDVLDQINPDNTYRLELEALADTIAKDMADQLGIATSGASYDLGGTMATFKPAIPGQAMPDVLNNVDEGGEWDD